MPHFDGGDMKQNKEKKQQRGFHISLHLLCHQTSLLGDGCFPKLDDQERWGSDGLFWLLAFRSVLPPSSHPVLWWNESGRGIITCMFPHFLIFVVLFWVYFWTRAAKYSHCKYGNRWSENRNGNVSDPACACLLWFHLHSLITHLLEWDRFILWNKLIKNNDGSAFSYFQRCIIECYQKFPVNSGITDQDHICLIFLLICLLSFISFISFPHRMKTALHTDTQCFAALHG